MPPTLQDLGIDRLSADDRLALAEAIWDSVAREVEQSPLTEVQRKELERRLADSIARPEAVTPWEVVKARALVKLRLLEERYEASQRERGGDEHVRELSMRSLRRLVNQLKEEIARFESRSCLRANGG